MLEIFNLLTEYSRILTVHSSDTPVEEENDKENASRFPMVISPAKPSDETCEVDVQILH